jgi:hypothetical protein
MARHPTPHVLVIVLVIGSCAAGAAAQITSGLETFESQAGSVLLTGLPDGRIVRDDLQQRLSATPTRLRPGTPVARLIARRPGARDPFDTLQAPPPVVASSDCLVDFSDYDALDRLTYAPDIFPLYAEDGHVWSPWWFQACNGIDHAVVRPIAPFDHFHLGYENPAIGPCYPSVIDWDIIHDDGTCEEFDPRLEPRRLTSHDSSAAIHLYLYDGSDKKLFGLDGLRVVGDRAIRLCYKPMQEDDGAWETSEPGGTTSPGIWLCWDELASGTWDLSGYAGSITEVKLSSSGKAGSISFDDVRLKLY